MACLLAAALVGACRRGPAPGALTVPVAPWLGYAYLQLAQERGFDRLEGVSLSIVRYDDPQAIVQAWLAGELKLAPLTSVEVVDICGRRPDRCPVVVLILDESRGADKLLVRASISDLRDLRGRRVGLATSSLGPYVLSRALASVDLDIADVTIAPMQPAQMASALRNGRVDAVAAYPPFSDLVLGLGIARVGFDSRAMPGEIFDLLVVDPAFLAANRPALVGLLRSWQRAQAWARRSPDEATAALADQLKVSPTAVRRSGAEIGLVPLAAQVERLAPDGPLVTSLAAVQEVQQQLGIVRPGAPLPAVSDELVRQALQPPGRRASAPK